jgi:hypothetical protein
MDDFFLAAAYHQDCLKRTELLLHLLWEAGYKVSKKKAQICQDQVKYLGFHISQGQQSLGAERKQAVCSIPTQTSKRQIHEFLEATGFCWIWIPSFSLLVRPLYEATKRGEREPLIWESEQQPVFMPSRSQCPCSGTPRCEKDFLPLCA